MCAKGWVTRYELRLAAFVYKIGRRKRKKAANTRTEDAKNTACNIRLYGVEVLSVAMLHCLRIAALSVYGNAGITVHTGYRPDEETLSAIHRVQIHSGPKTHTPASSFKICSTIHCHSAKTFFPRLHSRSILSIFFSAAFASFNRLPLAGHPFLLLLLILIFFNGKKYT